MKKSKILMLLLCLVMILAVSAVSAAEDTYDSPLQAVDDGAVDVVASSDADVLGDGEKTFVDLDTFVCTDEVNLKLEYDYKYNATVDIPGYEKSTALQNGVIIRQSCTIDGQGHYIDGSNSARIFRVDSFCDVTLKNIIFKNGNATLGGAIYSSGKLTLENCTFVNNTGGSVYMSEEQPLVTIVDDEASFNAQINNPNSVLSKYYYAAAREDGIDINGNNVRDSNTIIVGHSFNSAVDWPDPRTWPWIVINTGQSGVANLTIKYDGQIVKTFINEAPRYYGYYIRSIPGSGRNGLELTQYMVNRDGSFPTDAQGNPIRLNASKLEVIFQTGDINRTLTPSDVYKDASLVLKDCNFEFVTGTINVDDIVYGSDLKINGTLNVGANAVKSMNLLLNNEKYATITLDENNKFTSTIPNVPAGTYTISFSDDNGNTFVLADGIKDNFVVSKYTPALNVASSDVYYPADVIVNVTSDVTGTYSVTVGTKSQYARITAGVTQSFAFEDLDVNEDGYTITAYYSETENYNYVINNAVTVKVLPAQGPKATVLTAIASEVTDSSAVINITLTDVDGNKLTKLVTVRVGDSIVPVNVVNGTGSLPLSNLALGTYTANAVFAGDENYTNSSATVSFEIKPIYPTAAIITPSVETTYKDAVVKVTLSDKYGAKLNGVVTVTIGNDTSNVTVTNGEGSLALSNLAAGFYSANVAYAGDANHTNASSVVSFAISNAVLLANDTKRGWNSPYDYYATLVDINGKPIAGKDITFTIDGTAYKATTGADGIAKVAAKLDVGTHSVVVTNPDTGANFTVTAVIVERIQGYGDITKDYLGPESYVVQVFGDDGNPVGEGEVVQVRFAGKTYNMTTNASGYIIRTINFVPGFYAVYSSYAGYQTPQTGITVNQILKVAAVTASKSGKSFKLKASLKSSSGKAISDVKIKFTFRGNVYYGTTNAKGVASCKVSSSVIKKLTVGNKYTYKATYVNDIVSGKVTIAK